MIDITVICDFERYSHFNTIIVCGGFDTADNQLYLASSNKAEGESTTLLSCEDAHRIEVIVYIIPKSLPGGKDEAIENFPPFEARVTIENQTNQIHNKLHSVNGWGGAVVHLKVTL